MELGWDPKTSTPKRRRMKNRTDYDFKIAAKIETDIKKKRVFRVKRIIAAYMAAYAWRKHGENVQAERWLKDLETFKGKNSIIDRAADGMRISIKLERRYQRLAMERYEVVVKGKTGDVHARAEMAYLVAECHRRLGDPKSAAPWYDRAIKLTPSERLRTLATQQKQ